MLLSASRLLHLPIQSSGNGKNNLALCKAVVVDPKHLSVLGLLLYTGVFGQNKIVNWRDIIGINPDAIMIKKEDDIVGLKEIVRVAQALDQKIPIFNQKVCTKSGKYLGNVQDFIIAFETGLLAKIYVKPTIAAPFTSERIISRSSIIKVTPEKIVVKNDLGKIKLKAKARVLKLVALAE